jgi:predicted transposase/invertase (TIGR01784 family)
MKYLNAETNGDLAMIAERSPTLKEATHFLLDMSEDAVTRCAMESIRRREMDDRYKLEAALEEGMEKGILKTAKAMKADGVDVNTIAKWTGLTVDDILKM